LSAPPLTDPRSAKKSQRATRVARTRTSTTTTDAVKTMSPVPPRWRRSLLLVLLAAACALALTQLTLGRTDLPVAWLATVPLVASVTLSVKATTMAAAAVLLLGALVEFGTPGRGTLEWARVLVLSLLCGFAIVNALLRTLASARLERVRAVARVAQGAILHEIPVSTIEARFASRYVSATEEAQVGGDLLDVVGLGDRARWVVGDTKGKGLPAVQLASAALNTFRDVASRNDTDLPEVVRNVDATVRRQAGEEDFVTAVFCELSPQGWLQVISCGHPPPLLVTPEGFRLLEPPSYTTPLGLAPQALVHTHHVNPGDRLLLYTDGLLECRDRQGSFFRLADHIDLVRDADTVDDIVKELLHRLRVHGGGRTDDDIALLAVEVRGAEADNPQST
jgi:sigma-B regulation protein RsbU (phosphoserine phosphatase)